MKFSFGSDSDSKYEMGWTYIRFVVDIAREPFLILDNDLRVVSVNDAFLRMFLVTQEQTESNLVYDLGNGQWNSSQLRALLEDILPKSNFFKDFEVEHDFPLIGRKVMMVNARMMYVKDDKKPYIIMAFEDVTKHKLLEEQLLNYSKRLEQNVMDRTLELEKRISELEVMNKSMVDRELRMVELKKEMEVLRAGQN